MANVFRFGSPKGLPLCRADDFESFAVNGRYTFDIRINLEYFQEKKKFSLIQQAKRLSSSISEMSTIYSKSSRSRSSTSSRLEWSSQLSLTWNKYWWLFFLLRTPKWRYSCLGPGIEILFKVTPGLEISPTSWRSPYQESPLSPDRPTSVPGLHHPRGCFLILQQLKPVTVRMASDPHTSHPRWSQLKITSTRSLEKRFATKVSVLIW